METPEGKVSLLDAIPVRCDHILTEWEGDYADRRAAHGAGDYFTACRSLPI